MKYHIYYFSATGNNEHCSEMIEKALKSAKHTVARQSINIKTKPLEDKPDRIIIVFPTLAWMAPSFVHSFIKKLPRVEKNSINAAVFTADGGDCLQALSNVASLLRKRGYQVNLTARAKYTENWLQVMPPLQAKESESVNKNGDKITAEFIGHLLSGESKFYRVSALKSIFAWTIGHLFLFIGRRFLGKMFIADSDCNSCRLCALTCPAAAINMKPGAARPYWNLNCSSCNRCINICPKKAINSSGLRIIFLLSALTLFSFSGIYLYLKITSPFLSSNPVGFHMIINFMAITIIIIAAHVAAITIFDFAVLKFIQKMPVIRKLFEYSFNKKYIRYTMPGYKVKKEGLID